MNTAGPPGDDDGATPDELLLELMDLVALAFPAPLFEMTVSFVPNEDGRRPALANLDGKGRPDSPKRPDLGHNDNKVLDAINALLRDFVDATYLGGGVRPLEGRIDIKAGDDGDRFVELKDETGAVLMTRRFDKSELRWLFWTAPLFAALEATEAQERAQREALDAALKAYASFRIDMQQGTIEFTGAAGGKQFAFELVGSWADESKRFLWGWANEQAPASVRKRVDALRAASTGEGLRALTEESFGCPEGTADRLARHAAVKIGATGLYRAPFSSSQGKGFMYLALFDAA